MAATCSKTSSDLKRGNFEEDDVQMPLKLVKELLKQQGSTLKVFLIAYMDFVNTRIDNLKDVQSVKSSLEFTQAQVEELITSDLRVKEVKVQIEDLGTSYMTSKINQGEIICALREFLSHRTKLGKNRKAKPNSLLAKNEVSLIFSLQSSDYDNFILTSLQQIINIYLLILYL